MRSLIRSGVFLIAVALSTVLVYGQIPNAGFETWSGGMPTGWMATNAPPVYITVTQVTTAHSGSYAVRGEVVTISGSLTMAPIIQVGSAGDGFAYTQRPTSLTGWYQFTPASGSTDQFLITVTLMKSGTVQTAVAAGSIKPAAASSYTQFTVPLTYVQTIAPDLCFIQFALAPPSGSPKVGSSFIVDDIAFSTAPASLVEGNSSIPGGFLLEQNYPNPFNPSTAISFQLSASSFVKLDVINTLGQVVETVVDGIQAAGRHTARWDAAGQPSGVYYYRLQARHTADGQAEAFTEMKKMILLR